MNPVLSTCNAVSTDKGLHAKRSKGVFRTSQAIRGTTNPKLSGRCVA